MEEMHSLAGQKKQGWVWKVFARGNPRQWEQGGWAYPGSEFRGITGQFHLVCCNQPESGMHSTYILLQNLLSDSIQLSKPVLSPWAWPHPANAHLWLLWMERDGWILQPECAVLWECSWMPLWEQRQQNTQFLTTGGGFHTCGAVKMQNPARDILHPPWWDTQDTWTTQRAARPPRTPGAFRTKHWLRLKCDFGSCSCLSWTSWTVPKTALRTSLASTAGLRPQQQYQQQMHFLDLVVFTPAGKLWQGSQNCLEVSEFTQGSHPWITREPRTQPQVIWQNTTHPQNEHTLFNQKLQSTG